MLYAAFKTYFLRSLWRTGDADLEADLDTLITKAEKKIDRDLQQLELTAVLTVDPLTSSMVALPADYNGARAVWLDGYKYAAPTTMQQYQTYLSRDDATFNYGKFFTVRGDTLYILTGATPSDPEIFHMDYFQKLVPYSTDPASSFYDKYPDFYEAAVRVQTYEYLREWELSQEHNTKYNDLLDRMERDQARKMFPAGPIDAPLPGIVM